MDLPRKLSELIGADAVLTAPADLAPYLTDHRRLYQGTAAAVVLPRTTEQVSRVVAFCNGNRIGVVPQGGNTGYVGGATPLDPGAIVLALGRMNRIRAVDAANFALIAEAGCTLSAVQDAALAADRLFPMSLGSEGSCQIGGNLATNAGGTAVVRYGMMRDLAFGLEAVLSDGSVISQLSPLAKDNTGYNLTHLLIGSEGTLGVITAACLKLFPRPRATATAWVAIPSPAAALQLLERLRAAGDGRLSTLELIPDVALALVLEHIETARDPGIRRSPWYLLVELTSSADQDLDALLTQALAAAGDAGLIVDAAIATSEAQRENFWCLREAVPEAQRKAGGSLKHDISVPVASLPRFVEAGATLVSQLAPEGFLVAYGHVGDGNLHFNVNQRAGADGAAFAQCTVPLRRAIHDLVAQFGGSCSAEHGIGKLKVDELRRYAQPAELAAMHWIKQAFDPHGILNPGKVL
jgi:FAD/FMN-containing dehydrogenase